MLLSKSRIFPMHFHASVCTYRDTHKYGKCMEGNREQFRAVTFRKRDQEVMGLHCAQCTHSAGLLGRRKKIYLFYTL